MPKKPETPDKSANPLKDALMRAAAKSRGCQPPARGDNRSEKKNYAQNLSTELAMTVAACLRRHYSKAG